MPWLDPGTRWPPRSAADEWQRVKRHAAWWTGDHAALQSLAPRGSFWWTPSTRQDPQRRLHYPAAADIAGVVADLVLGDGVDLEWPDVDEAWAAELWERVDLEAVLVEAAEMVSALGGAFLRPTWDPVTLEPRLSVVAPDAALPVWHGRRLAEVIFHHRLDPVPKSRRVWRWLERWTPGMVEHRLYSGDEKSLGNREPLLAHPETETLTAERRFEGRLVGRMLPQWIPNQLPTRGRVGSMWSQSDTAGREDVMDGLDEAWTSLLRDVRVGKSRIVAPAMFLERVVSGNPSGRGGGMMFDLEREVFTPLEMDPTSADKSGITPVTFPIRAVEHARVALELVTELVKSAGLAPESLGLGEGGTVESAAALRLRTHRSLRTRAKKRKYWRGPVTDAAWALGLIAGSPIVGDGLGRRPALQWPTDEALVDPVQQAQLIESLDRAGAVSLRRKVELAQPDLDPTQVEEEVARIVAEQEMVEDPLAGVV